jgi:transcription initiation factor IIE alpha subunit
MILLVEKMIRNHQEQIFKIDREMDLQRADNHYRCPMCTRIYSEDEAIEYNFTCPYDKEPLKFIDFETFRKEKETEKRELQQRIKELSELKSYLLKKS